MKKMFKKDSYPNGCVYCQASKDKNGEMPSVSNVQSLQSSFSFPKNISCPVQFLILGKLAAILDKDMLGLSFKSWEGKEEAGTL